MNEDLLRFRGGELMLAMAGEQSNIVRIRIALGWFADSIKTEYDFLSWLSAFRNFYCLDPRDKIYALLS